MQQNISLQKQFTSGKLTLNIDYSDLEVNELFGIAERKNNPKRQFLFVSKILGKHLEVSPQKMQQTYYLLSKKLQQLNIEFPAFFIGMAETATCLATGIFENFNTINNNNNYNSNEIFYIQSSRYKVQNCQVINFAEEHSHAPQQYINISENFLQTNILNSAKTLILIDDEISSGNTLKNVFLELRKHNFLSEVNTIILVSLTNFLSKESINNLQNIFGNITLKTCEILRGNYIFEQNLDNQNSQKLSIVKKDFSKNIVLNDNFFGRCGLDFDLNNMQNFYKKNIQNLVENVYLQTIKNYDSNSLNKHKILVLGSGEFMFFPYKFALQLQQKFNENNLVEVFFKATTRSPISATFDNSIIQNQIAFLDNYGEGIDNYIYNLKNHSYNQIILCVETSKINEKVVKNIIRKLKNCHKQTEFCDFKVIFFGGATYEICDFF